MNGADILGRVRENLRSRFLRNLIVVMSGVGSGQMITVAFIPVITRLYDPTAFGVFGVYMSVVSIFTSISTLRYDQALMLPKDHEDSVNLVGLSCVSVAGIAILSAAVCIPFSAQIAALMDSPDLVRWVWLIPVSVFFSGTYITSTAWSTRQKRFRPAAASHVVYSATASGSQCAAGTLNMIGILRVGAFGLIAGAIVGQICASFVLAANLLRRDGAFIKRSIQLGRMKKLAREYSDFPLYGSTQELLHSVSRNVPLLLLAHFFDLTVAGFYGIGVRVLQLPMNLVLISLRQVFFQKGSEVYNSGGDTYALFVKVTLALLATAAVPVLLVFLFAPPVFSFVLGDDWYSAGEYARWLVLWLGLLFANVPAVLFGRIYRKQRALWFQGTALMVCRVGALVLGGLYLSALETVILYSVVGVVFNAYVILWMWSFLRRVRGEAIP